MLICQKCRSGVVRKYGVIGRNIMTRSGRKKVSIQRYQCKAGHVFRVSRVTDWDDGFIERVVFIYLQCLSLNTTITIVREFYTDDILTKGLILDFIEWVADALPTIDEIDNIYLPKRSGYLAFDGVWFQFGK